MTYFNLDNVSFFCYIKTIFNINSNNENLLIDRLKVMTGGNITLTSSGRDSLEIISNYIFSIKPDSNIIVVGFTCCVVPAAIIKSGLSVKYVDINSNDFRIDLNHLEKIVDNNTSAIVVQHIFNARENVILLKNLYPNIFIIEDCAHSFGMKDSDGIFTGSKGHFAFYSFDHTKVVTSLGGGAIISHNLDFDKWLTKKEHLFKNSIVVDIILYIKYLGLFIRGFGSQNLIRKVLYKIWTLLFSSINTISKSEMNLVKSDINRIKPGSIRLALLMVQLNELERSFIVRKNAAKIYSDYFGLDNYNLCLRYPHISNHKKSRFNNRWFSSPLHPLTVNELNAFGYFLGDCPNSESVVNSLINLPTNGKFNPVSILKELNDDTSV